MNPEGEDAIHSTHTFKEKLGADLQLPLHRLLWLALLCLGHLCIGHIYHKNTRSDYVMITPEMINKVPLGLKKSHSRETLLLENAFRVLTCEMIIWMIIRTMMVMITTDNYSVRAVKTNYQGIWCAR